MMASMNVLTDSIEDRDRLAEAILAEPITEWAAKIEETPKEAYKLADFLIARLKGYWR